MNSCSIQLLLLESDNQDENEYKNDQQDDKLRLKLSVLNLC